MHADRLDALSPLSSFAKPTVLHAIAIQKAVTERGLDDLISQARKENPFPFDHQRQSDPRANNPPFPFPAAKD